MTIAKRMTDLLDNSPGCQCLVVGDVLTATVLRGLGRHGQRQEDFDAILAGATRCLGQAGAAALAALDGPGNGPGNGPGAEPSAPRRATLFVGDAMHVFVRADDPGGAPDAGPDDGDEGGDADGTEVICAVCDADTDLDALVPTLASLIHDEGPSRDAAQRGHHV
ncbi:MAG: hypothetical protein AAFR52_00815 [Pseudomonadota bacterium]